MDLNALKSKTLNAKGFVIVGDMTKKQKSQILAEIDSCVKNNKQFYILSTGSFIGEGFDLPILDSLFITMPISFKGRLIQYIGRIHRPFKNKKDVNVYDYFDSNNGLTIKMFKRRIPTYKDLNYQIISKDSQNADKFIYQVDLFLELQ